MQKTPMPNQHPTGKFCQKNHAENNNHNSRKAQYQANGDGREVRQGDILPPWAMVKRVPPVQLARTSHAGVGA